MPEFLEHHPGLLYVVATLLPLASFVLLLLVGGLRNFVRKAPEGSVGAGLFRALGGDTPGRGGAYVATAAIFLAFVCSVLGFIEYVGEEHHLTVETNKLREQVADLGHKLDHGEGDEAALTAQLKAARKELEEKEGRWAGSVGWASVTARSVKDPGHATALRVGYRIDSLTAVMFLMVTFVATLIHVFSIGYMGDETEAVVEDHEVHVGRHHLRRRGRFGQFFMYLSLFCFSMLNLVLADNLFQVFISWELVGICSFLLIGFYFERHTATSAANKAFITNRVGDAGFILGLLIVWTYLGTFNFEEIFQRVRSPERGMNPKTHNRDTLEWSHQIVRARLEPGKDGKGTLHPTPPGTTSDLGGYAVLFPRDQADSHFAGLGPKGKQSVTYHENPGPDDYGAMTYRLPAATWLGDFIGRV